MKIALIGRTAMLYRTAERLLSAGHTLGCIVTAAASPEYEAGPDEFRLLAENNHADYFFSSSLKKPEIRRSLAQCDIAVSINWVSVITGEETSLLRLGILNAHCGDLPKYRGNACPNWAILNGEDEVVLSIHRMEGGKLDCGKIIAQEHFSLKPRKKIGDVYEWLEKTIPELFQRSVTLLDKDPGYSLKYADPEAPDSFRCYPRMPEDGWIDWTGSAEEIDALVRASGRPFAGAYCYFEESGRIRKLIVWDAEPEPAPFHDLAVPGQILRNDRTSGKSFICCGGHSVLALLNCQYADEDESFAPGKVWKTIRRRLTVRAEDVLWKLQMQEGK